MTSQPDALAPAPAPSRAPPIGRDNPLARAVGRAAGHGPDKAARRLGGARCVARRRRSPRASSARPVQRARIDALGTLQLRAATYQGPPDPVAPASAAACASRVPGHEPERLPQRRRIRRARWPELDAGRPHDRGCCSRSSALRRTRAASVSFRPRRRTPARADPAGLPPVRPHGRAILALDRAGARATQSARSSRRRSIPTTIWRRSRVSLATTTSAQARL